MKINNEVIAEKILKFINMLIFFEKKSIFQYKNIKLYPSEIHLLYIIADEQNTGVTAMAEKLGVTKGAVSQTLSRLEKKKILYKTKDPYNKNELTAYFTPAGKEIFEEHKKIRISLKEELDSYFSTLSGEEKKVIMTFLSKMNDFFKVMA